jgi:hypothetical protein
MARRLTVHPKILFIGGSLNQTTQAHAIGKHLEAHYDCYYSATYCDGLLRNFAERGWFDWNVLGETGKFHQQTNAYLAEHHLKVDYRGEQHDYDLVVTTSDLIIQRNIRHKRIILVQEGMTDPPGLGYHLVRWLKLPRYLASTASNGLSDAYELFCVASEGYKEQFVRKGVRPEKIIVTGIPNHDNAAQYLANSIPFQGYVLVATSDARETLKWDNRQKFICQAIQIANGRPLIFKLHPNENAQRATQEIIALAPDALVLTEGKAEDLIANCEVLITQYSTCAYTGLALGKEVHSYFDIEQLKRLLPRQNGGQSAENIARICRVVLEEGPVAARERFAYAFA